MARKVKTEKSTAAPKGAAVGKQVDEAAIIAPERTIEIAGTEVTVREFTFMDSLTLNREIAAVVDAVSVPVQVGGGVRSRGAADAWLAVVARVVLGTVAVTDPGLVAELLGAYGPERVVVTVDARDGRVAVRGWAETSEVDALALARRMADLGVRQLIYTDVSRDGTLRGIDPEPVARMRDAFAHRLVAGGGVATDADLDLYERLGLDGAIVGRALYEGTVRYPRTA